MNDPEAIPPAILRLAEALVAGVDLNAAPPQRKKTRTKPYRVAEVAGALDVHRSTVYRDIEAGRCRAYRVGSGRGTLRISVDDFESYKDFLRSRAATHAETEADTEVPI